MLFDGDTPLFDGDIPRLAGQEECCCDDDCSCPTIAAPAITIEDNGSVSADGYRRDISFVADGGSPSPAAGEAAVSYSWMVFDGEVMQFDSQAYNYTWVDGGTSAGMFRNYPAASTADFYNGHSGGMVVQDSHVYPGVSNQPCGFGFNIARRAKVGNTNAQLRWGGVHFFVACQKRVLFDDGRNCWSDWSVMMVRNGLCDTGAPVASYDIEEMAIYQSPVSLYGWIAGSRFWRWELDNVAAPADLLFQSIEIQFDEASTSTTGCDSAPTLGTYTMLRFDPDDNIVYQGVEFIVASLDNVSFDPQEPSGSTPIGSESRPPDCILNTANDNVICNASPAIRDTITYTWAHFGNLFAGISQANRGEVFVDSGVTFQHKIATYRDCGDGLETYAFPGNQSNVFSFDSGPSVACSGSYSAGGTVGSQTVLVTITYG